MIPEIKETMRDVLIEKISEVMSKNKKIFFLSDDFGAPKLDFLRKRFKDRFINVGISEQNLINISCGLALEGFIVYAYGISTFVTMRNYEQIRQNLSVLSQIKNLNVNIIGVGAGMSYDISGPSHHCFEDITIIRLLPNFILFSPSDNVLVRQFVDFSVKVNQPKYIRLDGKPLPEIYSKNKFKNFNNGFEVLNEGENLCIVATGYMTHTALEVSFHLKKQEMNIGVIDVFLLTGLNEKLFSSLLKRYKIIVTLEEGFINSGGLDSLVNSILLRNNINVKVVNLGIRNKYIYTVGSRKDLHKILKIDSANMTKICKKLLKKR